MGSYFQRVDFVRSTLIGVLGKLLPLFRTKQRERIRFERMASRTKGFIADELTKLETSTISYIKSANRLGLQSLADPILTSALE